MASLDLSDLPPEVLRELRPPKVDRDAVAAVLSGEVTQVEAARKLGVSQQVMSYHAKKARADNVSSEGDLRRRAALRLTDINVSQLTPQGRAELRTAINTILRLSR